MPETTVFDTAGLWVYLDGQYQPGADAKISIFDHGLLYGDGVFEGMRVRDGKLFRVADHLERLSRSCRALQIDFEISAATLVGIVGELTGRSLLDAAHVRVVVTRGFGAPGLNPWNCPRPSLIVMAYPFPPFLGDKPLRLMTSSVVRKAPRSLGAAVKSLNYLDAISAKLQARACGMDDAIMLDSLGAVAECTSTNIFLERDGSLVTPTTRAALPGVTRKTIIELCGERGIDVVERDVWPAELHTADGMFVTGTAAGLVPVGAVDGFRLPTDGSQFYEILRAGYDAATASEALSTPLSAPPHSSGDAG